ncbi:phospholipase A [Alteromonas oceanisediminis]|uniref:phospholipase A n=1 Tax=Alteromonas oceanisediminis TaxID=2836180 RepID=UPI002023B55E|nr:phospholipase A [Alteromonas oceanisediminis]
MPVLAQNMIQKNAESPTPSLLDTRGKADKEANTNPFSISQHRRNYLLPVTHITNPNTLGDTTLTSENVDNAEAKFQVSVKVPLYIQSDESSGVYFGFTAVSYWQVYNDAASKPFRETNYEPEVFYQWDADLNVLGYRFNAVQLGLNHQSNGQSGLRSRSWNRIIASALFSDEDSLYYVKTWLRLPEDDKTDPMDPTGDDNPDINDFYGRMEIGYGVNWGPVDLLVILRNNLRFDNNRGGIEFNVNYPLNERYDLLFQYFNGYGDSLIDYNRAQERIGLGIQLRFL